MLFLSLKSDKIQIALNGIKQVWNIQRLQNDSLRHWIFIPSPYQRLNKCKKLTVNNYQLNQFFFVLAWKWFNPNQHCLQFSFGFLEQYFRLVEQKLSWRWWAVLILLRILLLIDRYRTPLGDKFPNKERLFFFNLLYEI